MVGEDAVATVKAARDFGGRLAHRLGRRGRFKRPDDRGPGPDGGGCQPGGG